ncbi:MAG: hypothetical protein ABI855_11715 [Bacteroidota bacterium]
MSNSKGLCTIYVEKEGDYTLEIIRENFITMTLKATVQKGSNTFNVELSPVFNVPAVNKEKVNK